MKKSVVLSLSLLLTLNIAWAQLTGTKNIPGDYSTLALAITALNNQGVGPGGVTLNLLAGNPQTAPAGGYVIGGSGSLVLITASEASPIILLGNGNTITAHNPQPTGSLLDALIKIVGGDFITIDGFVLQENSLNTQNSSRTEFGIALLYFSGPYEDGCQNITIKNNTIILNRTYTNTFGIYSNSRHRADNVGSNWSPLSLLGGNHNLVITGNHIENVNMGIVVAGPSNNDLQNNGLIIGGSEEDGNTITNFGTGLLASPFTGVEANSVNGIFVRNTYNFNISHNTLQNSGSSLSGTDNTRLLSMINISGASKNAVCSNSVSNNHITTGGILNHGYRIIRYEAYFTAASIKIDSNDFYIHGEELRATYSWPVSFIYNRGCAHDLSISGNRFHALSVRNNYGLDLIYNDMSPDMPNGCIVNVNQNQIVNGFTMNSMGIVNFYIDGSYTKASATMFANNNHFAGVIRTAGGDINGIRHGASGGALSSLNKTISSNIFDDWTISAGNISCVFVSSATSTISHNTISNILKQTTQAGSSNIYGIQVQGGSFAVNNNTIHSLTTNGPGEVTGIYYWNSAPRALAADTIAANRIYNLTVNNAGGSVNGIHFFFFRTQQVFVINNVISGLKAPVSNQTEGIAAIRITPNTANDNTRVNLYYNTIYLDAVSEGENFGSSGIYHRAESVATNTTLDMRNNIIINKSVPKGTGLTVAFRRTGSELANYSITSNHNLFYAGEPDVNRLIYYDGTNADEDISAYRSRVAMRDAQSFTENPDFLSLDGNDEDFLRPHPTNPTQIESGGFPIPGIHTDVEGNIRYGSPGYIGNGSAPDIGAYESDFVMADLQPPLIAYEPVSKGAVENELMLQDFAIIFDASGIDSSEGNRPRIYYKKKSDDNVFIDNTNNTSGWKWMETISDSRNSDSLYSFTINYSLLYDGNVALDDTIMYFIVAQDNQANPLLGVNLCEFPQTPDGVSLGVNHFPVGGAINEYKIHEEISGEVSVGTDGDFPSLTGEHGLFMTINSSVVSGNITAKIISNLDEPGTYALYEYAEKGIGNYTLYIEPDSETNRLISGNYAGGLIRLTGADRVVIDGRFNEAGSFLTFENTDDSTDGAVFWIGSMSFENSANDITIRDCSIRGFSPGSTRYGIFAGSGNTLGVEAESGNNHLSFINNHIYQVYNGIVVRGSANGQTGLIITNNLLGHEVLENSLGHTGIFLYYNQQAVVENNIIFNISSDDANPTGIIVSTLVLNSTFVRNHIHSIRTTGSNAFGAKGIDINTLFHNCNLLFANNIVSNIGGKGSNNFRANATAGIRVGANDSQNRITSGIKFYFNTIHLGDGSFDGHTSGTLSAALYLGSETFDIELKNNIFSTNLHNPMAATARTYAIYSHATAISDIDYNNYFVSGAQGILGFMGTAGASTLANWQSRTGQDNASYSINPVFISSDNPKSSFGNYLLGIHIPDISLDFENNPRSNPPDIGAWEASEAGRWLGGNSQDWNDVSNWDNGTLPVPDDHVVIHPRALAYPVVNNNPGSPAICAGLTILEGAGITIGAGKALTVTGTILNQSGISGIIIKSNASGTGSLLNNTPDIDATIERYFGAVSGD